MPIAALKEQYEAYPYPPRDPADEAKRLVTGAPSSLDDLEHYLFSGRLPKKLRLLSAGGGTGDAIIQMAAEAQERGIEAELVHLDLSAGSQAIAKARAAARKLTSITFVNDSLLNAAKYGPFDYIDCCGVLHHLDVPEDGLKALVDALKPEGGLGIMLYAPLGRTGVYPLQSALRRLLPADLSPPEKVRLAKKLLAELPETNWLKRNPLIKDHEMSDSGLYDLLLHSQDRAYDVPQFIEFAKSAGLEVVEFVQPVKYDPTLWVKSPELIKKLPADKWARAALAEELCGSMFKHIAYLTRAGRTRTVADFTPESVPFYHYFEGVSFGQKLPPGGNLIGQLAGMSVNMTLPRRAGLIMQRINGRSTWREIHADLSNSLGSDAPNWDAFWTEATELYHKLQGVNVLLLRTAPLT
jgi:SAM-dependent methyltransferase